MRKLLFCYSLYSRSEIGNFKVTGCDNKGERQATFILGKDTNGWGEVGL
jgi:hypothetical protein